MKRIVAVALLAAFACAGVVRVVRAQDKEEPVDPRILAYDKGPAKIDVSKYPKDMQDRYKVFAKKCSACHTLARPINSDYVLEEEWERYVKRMMRKAGTITADEGKQIYEFLAYDSKTRKKAKYDQKLAEVKNQH
jgi:hypothetical protein